MLSRLLPTRWKQSVWLRWLKPIKRWLFPPPPPVPIPPILVPSHWTGAVEPPPSAHRPTVCQRARFFGGVTSNDLEDQVGSPDIKLRVRQVLNHLRQRPRDISSQAGQGQSEAGKWDWRHVLTWYAWRFRPAICVEIGLETQVSTAMVALNSPETSLISFVPEPNGDPSRYDFIPDAVFQELIRCGHYGPITFFTGRVQERPLLHLSRRPWRSAAGQVGRGDIDILVVNGWEDAKEFYRVLKRLLPHCALGGMALVKTPSRQSTDSFSHVWPRLQKKFPSFRYLTVPDGKAGLAFRVA